MPQDFGFKVVTLDEGDGPVKAIKDPGGRILTAEQMDAIRQKQEADLAQAAELRDKLAAGDVAATGQIVSQVREGMVRQLAVLDRQKADTAGALAKLEAGEAAAVADVVSRMKAQLDRRMEMVGAARDHSVQLLAQIAPTTVVRQPAIATPTPAT